MKDYTLSVDTQLGGATPSDTTAVSQKAMKTYTDESISALNTKIDGKADSSVVSGIQGKIPAEATSANKLADKAYVDSSITAVSTKIADKADKTSVTAIEGKIPDEASSSNQLADKAYVDSTITTKISGKADSSVVSGIQEKIPPAASSTNQLADKEYVGTAVSSMSANYVTSDASGNAFPTKAKLISGPYYMAGAVYTPTKKDYAVVITDESQGDTTVRYQYNGTSWDMQYIINETPLTEEQRAALNSGITSTKVGNYDTHISSTSNPHSVTAEQVGLGSVANTGDSATPVENGTTKFTTGGAFTELAKKVDTSTKTLTVDASSTDLTFPSAKAVYDAIQRGGGVATLMESKTYAELTAMITAKTLVPGMLYRITDFATTCSGSGSVSGVLTQSANHPFDIVVYATDKETLDTNAAVCLHSGDSYFANSKPERWLVKYTVDNDTARYKWAVSGGKGVIFYMRDEFGNEAGYDFKNIQFKRKLNSSTGIWSDRGTGTGTVADEGWAFTFSSVISGNTFTDLSLTSANDVNGNYVGTVSVSGAMALPGNCSFGTGVKNNKWESGCTENTLGAGTINNVMSSGCYSSCVCNNAQNNMLGSGCGNVTVNADSSNNMYGPGGRYCFV